MSRNFTTVKMAAMTDEELIEFYLSLPRKEREQRFASTADVAALARGAARRWSHGGSVGQAPAGEGVPAPSGA